MFRAVDAGADVCDVLMLALGLRVTADVTEHVGVRPTAGQGVEVLGTEIFAPGTIGSEPRYFGEMVAAVEVGGPSDIVRISGCRSRHGGLEDAIGYMGARVTAALNGIEKIVEYRKSTRLN